MKANVKHASCLGAILLGFAALCLQIALSLVQNIGVARALEPGDVVMSINPSNQELELRPGAQYEGTVKVSNIGRLPFKVKASVRPFYVKNDDYEPDFASESAYTKIYNWIKLGETEFTIEPDESHELKFTVDVPKDVASGGQYAAIMLLSDSGEAESAGVNVAAQLAAILYGHVNGGEMRTEGELVGHTMPGIFSSSNFSISETVKNTGNVDFRVEHALTVTEFFSNRELVNKNSVSKDGQLIGSSNSVVLPGTSRTGILTWPDAPKLGLFNVTQTIRFLDQELTFHKLVFLCPLWLLVIVIALVIVLIIWIVRKVMKKKQQKAEIKSRNHRGDEPEPTL